MAKKDFNQDFVDSLLDQLTGPALPTEGAKRTPSDPKPLSGGGSRSSEDGDKEHISTMMFKDYIAKLRYISKKHGISIVAIINKAVKMLIDIYESKYGVIHLPKGKKEDVDSVFDL